MTVIIHSDDVDRFRAAIERGLGLHFDESKRDFLAEVLHARLQDCGRTGELYLEWLESENTPAEWHALGQKLTVPETYFFRHNEQFCAFSDVVLPARLRAQAAQRQLKILSAGCASGEEAYTLAILLRETPDVASWHIDISGVDINPAVIDKARRARYSTWALRETTTAMQRRWFRPAGRDNLLDESIRDAVHFEQRNLAVDDAELWRPHSYDVIFCRNVLMYFTPENAQRLVGRIARALVPGGYLFLGHAETLRGLSQDFHLCHTHDAFYYRRRGESGATVQHEPLHTARTAALAASPTTAGASDTDWMDAIQRASERIHALAALPVPGSSPTVVAPWDLRAARDLLRAERYAEALDAIHALPPEAEHDNDVLLLQAVLLSHAGRCAEAERSCKRLLSRDELNAGAHYVMALCRESVSDTRGATEHNRTATYLDPSFAMPRLQLGLLARRAEDVEATRRELAQALALLQREEPARLLMYGGGFSREALLALCRAELKACGGGGAHD